MSGECAYIFGDPANRPVKWCRQPVHAPGAVYCPEHHELCHLPQNPDLNKTDPKMYRPAGAPIDLTKFVKV